jgi:hypothetical protein
MNLEKMISVVVVTAMIAGLVFMAPLPGEARELEMRYGLKYAHASFWGEGASDDSGYDVAGVGDVNGDGFCDFVIGAPYDDDNGASSGQTYLILGKAAGWAQDTALAASSASFWGEAVSDEAGRSVAGAGDVNGDGFDDILIGAPGNDEAGADAGQIYLILGRASGWAMDTVLSAANASFWGEDAGDAAGLSVAGAGDVNRDGYDDFIIGAYGDDDGGDIAGQAYLVLGMATGWAMDTDLSAASASFWGEDASDAAGWSVAGAGDVNMDGYDDFIIGALWDDDGGVNAGQTYLILGMASGWLMDTDLSAASASFRGEDAADVSGGSVAGAGDVNGDGYDDFIIGATGDDDGGSAAGQTYLILGKASGWAIDTDLSASSASFWGEKASDYSGNSISGAGDVNGDGYDDILIGAYQNDDGYSAAGQTYLIHGKPAGWAMDTDLSASSASFWGEAGGDNSGFSVAGVGDTDGNGFDDILIGAQLNDEALSNAGQTYLILSNCRPPSPLNLRASIGGEGRQVDLAWAKPPWNELITAYRIYRSTDGAHYSQVAVVNTLFFADFNVVPGMTYHYSVVTVDGSGEVSDLGRCVSVNVEAPVAAEVPGLGRNVDLKDAQASFWGEDASDYSGWSVSGAGDVNGDGYADFLIGAMWDDDGGSNAGQSYLILGKSAGLAADTDLSSADASFWGEDASDESGRSMACAGDVNGDGYDDFLICAPGDDDGGSSAGQTYLFLGKASGWAADTDLSAASASFWGEDGADYSGWSVAGAGDVNLDGYDDFLIGAYGDDDGGTDAGQTYLILGKASGWAVDTDLSAASASFWGQNNGDYSGYCVAGAGDVNGDGYADFLIGAYGFDGGSSDLGRTYLILGKPSGWAMDTSLSSASASFTGEAMVDCSGYFLSGAGDVNGDGYCDFIIGAFGNDEVGANAGQTYLVFGKASGWTMGVGLSTSGASFLGETADDRSGRNVAAAGDVNGDGYDDFLIGAILNDDGGMDSGEAYLIAGKASGWAMDTSLSAALASFWGEDAFDDAGWSVAGAGDVNGDGYADLLIGAVYDDDGGNSAGQTYLILPNAAPPAPKGLQAQLATSLKLVNLSWDAPPPWNSPVTGYRVCRSTDGGEYVDIAFRAPPDRTYTDTNVTYGRTYHYRVLTVDGEGRISGGGATVSLVCDRDTDSDGTGDMADWDDDGDGVTDGQDAFPLNPAESMDTDWDGIGNNADTDDDNDGIPDVSDPEPLNPQNELRYHINFLNSTLQAVQGQLASAQALLALMNGNLTSLTTSVNNMNTGLTNLGNTIRADINNLGAGVAVNMSGMNATLRADIVALQSWLSGMNGTLRADIASLQSGLSGMNATLRGDISTVLTGMAGMNATLRNDIVTVLGNMAGMNATLRNDIVTVIGNMAGMNSTLRNDIVSVILNIAGLNATLQNNVSSILNNISKINSSLDITQVMNGIAGMNSSLQNNISAVIGSMAGMNASLKGDIGNVVVAMAGMNASLKGDIGNVVVAMAGMNSSLRGNITTVLTAVTGMNSTFRTELLGVNASLAAAIAAVGTDVDAVASVVTGVSTDLASMRAYLVGMNASMAAGLSGLETELAADVTALETRLGADIAALGIALEAVNASVQLEFDGLNEDIAEFRGEVASGIAAIMAKLDQNNQTQNENYGKLQALVNAINSTSLADIRNQLVTLRTDNDQMEAGLIAKLDDFRNRTMTRLDNLTEMMAVLDDIRALSSDVQNLKTQVGSIKDQQAGTKKSVEALAPPSWGSMVLVIVVLVVAIVLLMMSRGKKSETAAAGSVPESKRPLPSKSVLQQERDEMKP